MAAICMLLARLSHPNRYKDLGGLQFGWKPERVSVITKALQTLLLDRWGHLLDIDHERLSKERLQLFADVMVSTYKN